MEDCFLLLLEDDLLVELLRLSLPFVLAGEGDVSSSVVGAPMLLNTDCESLACLYGDVPGVHTIIEKEPQKALVHIYNIS